MGIKLKHHAQLGSKSASYCLNKDLLFKFIIDAGHSCFRCGGILTRDDFSIDHKIPWLDNEKAIELFFDLDNIAFSHKSCNIKAGRRPNKKYNSRKENDAAYNKRRTQYYDKKRYLRNKEKRKLEKISTNSSPSIDTDTS